MATTERRKSISLFFGFSKQEPKTDATPDDFPKLRRKLQKVTKQVDSTDTNTTATNTTGAPAPAPDVGGVQTVKLPGDESFLSTKYNASRPPPSRDGSKIVAAAAEVKPVQEKQSRRRSFFRSSSTSRVPNASRSASCTRVATVTSTTTTTSSTIRPGSSRGESAKPAAATAITTTAPVSATKPSATERPSTATSTSSGRNNLALHANTSRTNNYGTVAIDTESRAAAELQARGDAQDKAWAQKKAAQAAAQARAFQMMEEHERLSAQERSSKSHAQKSTPPSASRTKRMTVLPLALGAQSAGTVEKTASRPYPTFHRPYSHSQHQNTITPKEADVRRTLSTASNRLPYPSRQSMHSAGLAPVTVSSMPIAIAPLSPIPSSAMSGSSSASMSSPTLAAFNLSSASLALTAATSFTQSYSTLPTSANGSSSSCATSSPDGSVVGSLPYALGQRRNHSKFDFDNESIDSNNSGIDGRRVVPELSYLSGASSRGSPPTPGSPSSVSSVDASSPSTAAQPRRKVKTPVYAIGQLESGGATSEDEAVTAITKQVELSLLQSKSSIECIAEEYRALLASRNSQSTADAQSEMNVDAIQRPISGRRSRSKNLQVHAASIGAQRKFMLASPGMNNAYNADVRLDSPLLPAAVFQEWPQRASITSPPPPPPLSPLRTRSSMMGISHNYNDNININNNSNIYNKLKTQTAPPPPQPQPAQTDNLSLQICVDLLTRELSSAVVRRSSPAAATAASQRAATRRHLQKKDVNSVYSPAITSPLTPLAPPAPPADTAGSALQILVMIEAYERLRDQLVADAQKKAKVQKRQAHEATGNNNIDTNTEEIEAMFGLWLKALYRIHDSLTIDEKNGEDDYEDDNDELDNTSDSDYDSAAESI